MPERIDRYELQATLGQGAMGVVYLGRDTKLDRDVALKVINPSIADNDTARGLFHREAKAIARLQHPSIIQLYDYSGLDSKQVYLVVERLRGKTLGDLVKDKQSFDYLLAAAIGYEVALGLHHAHTQGIVHRDLKPENIFVEPDGRVVLCDFGVARAFRSNAVHTLASQQTKLAGSPLYMSPEQILDPTSIGPASDLFSLGSVLFFMATGEAAFAAPNMHKVLKAVTEGTPSKALENNPRVPEGFARIVKRLLEKDPERRYATAQQVADALLGAFVPTPHRDPRRLIRKVYDAPKKGAFEDTQSAKIDTLRAANRTMLMLKQRKVPPPSELEQAVKPEPILLENRKREPKARAQHGVLLGAVGIALLIVTLAMITREVNAFEPVHAWIRDLLRRY